MAGKQFELRFPIAGVARRIGFRDSADTRQAYPTAWAVNCRAEDPFAKRLRGGSRPGLTKLLASTVGTTIAEIAGLDTASSTATTPKLAVLVDSTFKVVSGGAITTPTARMTVGGTSVVINSTGILLSSGTAPAAGMLCVRGNKAYCLASGGIVMLDTVTGQIDALVASTGTIPSGATVGGFYRDRLCLVKDNGVYLSRQGNPTDWNLGCDVGDAGRAVLFQLAGASEIGGDPTAFIPFQDAAALVSTAYGLWAMQGDPGTNGTLRCVSKGVGIISSRAWCKVEDAQVGDQLVRNGVVFLSSTGLHVVSPNGDGLRGLSPNAVPEELVSIAGTTTVRMVYRPDEQGVHIYLTPASGTGTHWFYDLANPGFWPMALQADHEPLAVADYDGKTVLACSDGYLRYVGGDNDDGTAIQSHVLIGPLRLGQPGTYGRVQSLRATLAEESGAVTWRLVDGDTAEQACENAKTAIALYQAGDTTGAGQYVAASGDLLAGRNTIVYPRIRAEWLVVWLQSTTKWAYETMILETEQSGRMR